MGMAGWVNLISSGCREKKSFSFQIGLFNDSFPFKMILLCVREFYFI